MVYKVSGNTVIDDSENVFLANVHAQRVDWGFQYDYCYLDSAEARSGPYQGVIERFPFANELDIVARNPYPDFLPGYAAASGAASSQEYGYHFGSYDYGPTPLAPTTSDDTIYRFPFADDTDGRSNVGDLASGDSYGCAGSTSLWYGYRAGGINYLPDTWTNAIERFPFASEGADAADVGDLLNASSSAIGSISQIMTYGYIVGGYEPASPFPTDIDTIQRWPFAAVTTNATDVGNLLQALYVSGSSETGYGCSSDEYGYTAGARSSTPSPAWLDVIQRWPFASGTTNSSDVGNLTRVYSNQNCAGSRENGYRLGGRGGSPLAYHNDIERWPFASGSTNSTDVGDLRDPAGYDGSITNWRN